MDLSTQINHFVNKVSQRELLLGECESDDALSATQEHILMLLARQHQVTNAKLADELSLSPAAITKAVKILQERGFVKSDKGKHDERIVELFLSATGQPIAEEHAAHHLRTMQAYQELQSEFSPAEQQTISNFLSKLEEVMA